MSEIRRIRYQLRAAFDGTPWHGPSTWDHLADLSADAAARHSVTDAHSIWELTLHMTYWRRVALEALAGKSIAGHQPGTPEDWRLPSETTEETWNQTRAELRQTQDDLLEALKKLEDPQLEENVPGRDYPMYIMIYGVIQHDVYHAGQIALLKKESRA